MEHSKRQPGPGQAILLLIIALCCQACASTTLTSSWINSGYQGPIKGPVFVLGVFKDPVAHKIYEDSFVAELEEAGLRAMPSYRYDLAAGQPTREALQQALNRSGASVLLITHLLAEKSSEYQFPEKHYALGGGISWDSGYGYYSVIYSEVWGGTEVDRTVDAMEASLFEVHSGQRIWSARARSVNLDRFVRRDDEQLEKRFIQDLREHRLL
ncbi:hypothetical protein [Desulfogranum mediterraneum]|uniref:hypothetical protein n=1 Tax=Desulfogranum mediterraneum TaxID=160661 RepID=UPI000411D42D|nr:hypothetical protein [Desulfogranum mediterraneum]